MSSSSSDFSYNASREGRAEQQQVRVVAAPDTLRNFMRAPVVRVGLVRPLHFLVVRGEIDMAFRGFLAAGAGLSIRMARAFYSISAAWTLLPAPSASVCAANDSARA